MDRVVERCGGLDVHKDTVVVLRAHAGGRGKTPPGGAHIRHEHHVETTQMYVHADQTIKNAPSHAPRRSVRRRGDTDLRTRSSLFLEQLR